MVGDLSAGNARDASLETVSYRPTRFLFSSRYGVGTTWGSCGTPFVFGQVFHRFDLRGLLVAQLPVFLGNWAASGRGLGFEFHQGLSMRDWFGPSDDTKNQTGRSQCRRTAQQSGSGASHRASFRCGAPVLRASGLKGRSFQTPPLLPP